MWDKLGVRLKADNSDKKFAQLICNKNFISFKHQKKGPLSIKHIFNKLATKFYTV
jgi:hypothetical protein